MYTVIVPRPGMAANTDLSVFPVYLLRRFQCQVTARLPTCQPGRLRDPLPCLVCLTGDRLRHHWIRSPADRDRHRLLEAAPRPPRLALAPPALLSDVRRVCAPCPAVRDRLRAPAPARAGRRRGRRPHHRSPGAPRLRAHGIDTALDSSAPWMPGTE